MTINNQLSIISENNHEYSANYDGNVSITSYSFDRNNENWETSIDYFSEILFMKLAEEFPSKRVYFWVKNIFCNVPSKIEKYKGIYNDKELLFLKTMANCNIFNHVTSEPYGFSALVEVKDSCMFSKMLNYLRNKDNGCFFLKDGLEKIIDLDNRIYYSFIDFASLVELMINQEYILLRPYGRFDDSKFYLEIYQKRIDFAN